MTTRILIADDSRTVRHSLHGFLEQHRDWKVCADAVDGTDAIARAQQFKPDVVVLDFFMPGMTGMEAARILKRVLPSIPILIVTLEITNQLVEQAKSVGVRGAVQKIRRGSDGNGDRGYTSTGDLFHWQRENSDELREVCTIRLPNRSPQGIEMSAVFRRPLA